MDRFNIQNNFITPWHIHNGTDAPKIPFNNLTGISTASVTVNPPSLTPNTGFNTTVSVSNAQFGDFVLVSFSLDTQDLIVIGHVSNIGSVTVRFQNSTAGTIDIASGILSVRIIKL